MLQATEATVAPGSHGGVASLDPQTVVCGCRLPGGNLQLANATEESEENTQEARGPIVHSTPPGAFCDGSSPGSGSHRST